MSPLLCEPITASERLEDGESQRDGGQCPPYDLLALVVADEADKPHARGLSPPLEDGLPRPSRSVLAEDGLPRPSRNLLCDGAIPGDNWSVEALGLRAQHELARIAADECQVTPAYWLLGKALNAARKHFAKKGTWENWLRERGIGADRAQKARRLATFFATPDDLAGLSLREALRLAKGESSNPATAKLLRNFDRRMRNAVQAARQVRQKVERGEERAALSRSIQTALNALAALQCELNQGEMS